MSHFHSYLDTAAKILEPYRGGEPFAIYLKKYFARNKKHGSRDRKQISHLCYCYFRVARVLGHESVALQIQQALFMCSTEEPPLLAALRPLWSGKYDLPVDEKLNLLGCAANLTGLFPWIEALSEEIDKDAFCRSFLIQPETFIRIRPGHEDRLLRKLKSLQLPVTAHGPHCLSFPSGTKLDDVFLADKEAVVQDYSSQRVGELLGLVNPVQLKGAMTVWDCCAASGGKSIMARDWLGNLALTVSDIRDSILQNLKNRFSAAGMGSYKSVVADLSQTDPFGLHDYFNLVIADVPCSGSGTWSRTPEQLCFFKEDQINQYSRLQKKIVSTAIPHVQSGGYFLYITCSVFKAENEEVTEYIEKEKGLTLIRKELIAGYGVKADSMFACLFRK